MIIEIEVPITCAVDVFETRTITTGMSKDIPGIGMLRLHASPPEKRSAGLVYDSMPFLHLAISLGRDVAVSLIANWLYDRLKGSDTKHIRINKKMVEITPDGIYKAIEETFEIEKR